MQSTNESSDYAERNYSYIEPVPGWTETIERVGRGIYVFNLIGVCFLIINIACMVLLSRICKRAGNQILQLIQTVSIAIYAMCLGICLTLDPYNRSNNIPVFMNNVLEQIADPCIIVAFFTIQNFLIKISSIKVTWNKLQSNRRIVTVLVLYIINLVILETTICFNFGEMKSMRLLSKFEFVIFSVYSCLCYLCTGFKAAMYLDYMKSPTKISDQILLDHPSDTETDSRCLISSSTRASTKATDNNGTLKLNASSTRTLYTSTDSTEEDEKKHKIQHAKKPRRKLKKQSNSKLFSKHFNSNIKLKNLHVNKVFHDSKVNLPLVSGDTPCLSKKSSKTSKTDKIPAKEATEHHQTNITDNTSFCTKNHKTLEQTSSVYSNCNTLEQTRSVCSNVIQYENAEDDQQKLKSSIVIDSKNSISKSDQISKNEDVPLTCSENAQTTNTPSRAMVLSQTDSFLDMESDPSCSDSLEDNGYLADGENINGISGVGQSSVDGDSIYSQFKQNKFESVTNVGDFPSTCSLIRIRQCVMLQKLITVAYFVTFAVVVNTIFHMYSIFGVYGIFGTHRAPRPWPWFLFQLLHRIIEVSLAVSQLVSIVIVLNSKPRRKKQRSRPEA